MKMNPNENITLTICWGCLSFGRQKVALKNDEMQCLIDIIPEDKITTEYLSNMTFCWECAAILEKILKFKNQVKSSQLEIIECLEKNDDITTLAKPSKLVKRNLFNICVDKFTKELELLLPKIEIAKDENVEHELNYEDQIYSADQISDDEPLIKKKKTLKSKKKKKNKKDFENFKEIMLSNDEIEKERELNKNREEFVNARFKCHRCLEIFANRDDFTDHVEMKHNTVSGHKCDICDSYVSSLTQHRATHARRYQCCLCTERSYNKRAARIHYDDAHARFDLNGEVPTSVPVEEKEHLLEVKENISQNGTEEMFMCEHCPKKFKWKTSLNRHVVVHEIANGRKRQPYCEACGLYFTNTVNLRKHMRTSSKHQIKLKLIKMKLESSETEAAEELASAVMQKMASFECETCGKRFQWRGNLQRHMKTHATRASRELVCEPCNRTFASLATYTQHMKISKKHVTEMEFRYSCGDCDRRFPDKMKLRDHVNWEHLKNYLHKCQQCQKVFKHRLNLQQHVQTVHNKNSGDHLCHLCGRAFPNRSKLTGHVSGAHGSAPHRCRHCGAAFSWRTCLARHLRRLHAHAE